MSDSDIVTRLRTNRECYAPCLFDDAADEIERLRKELQESEGLLDEYQRADADRTRWEER